MGNFGGRRHRADARRGGQHLRGSGVVLTICAVFVLFSSLVILWQVSQLAHGGETNYISATLTLYMSIYNLSPACCNC